MTDLRLPRLLLLGGLAATLVIIAAALMLASACALVDQILLPPPPGPGDPLLAEQADDGIWQVLDEARRITRDAAESEQ